LSGGIFRWTAPLFARTDRRWDEDSVDVFAQTLAPYLPEQGRLLDLGGGTGALAGHLARTVPCAVTVVDASPNMLRYADGLPGVEAIVGDAAALPFPDDNFDAALICDAFHHFRRRDEAVREMARVVRPGGGVVIAELDAEALSIRFIALAERLLGEPAGFVTPAGMEGLMAAAGVRGRSRPQNRVSYIFAGEVGSGRPPDPGDQGDELP